MAVIKLEIESCKDCPNFRRERHYTGDSWEEAYNWHCKAKEDKKIQGYVEWMDEKHIKIPEWCPIKEKEDESIPK
ncbi:hypothetical protein Phi4:1_gp149 [Cellulophaga phage phi4:1]|uniref:Uncharacterized protein n=3 Tax=Lightbulbvirus Cba41 TaxID=1918524 RepID=A0A0S2MWR0_9CAUD|nr:hypothetical protein Phi4:1_gp149 [Cellulophaga phage phi4:1]AGO49562.1 hypothetical protein Phi4:1_gp149 [Cellulophaga phage phi4:1]ALO80158.1 hypothetical protein Phi4113_149 [Cellulophaga phage phi4:1_13]ALO80355.1 hypothetical protein Phi4118_149 [Cellulophaga phage phi4:1_18]